MALITFDPPGFLTDLQPQFRQEWHLYISDLMDSAQAGYPADFDFDGPRAQFFNPARVDIGEGAASEDITWTAFPRQVQIASISDTQRWKRADASRDAQDEYCEWSVERDGGKIRRVTFTCEGPEYWGYLAVVDPNLVVALYKEFVSGEVKREDLFDSSNRYRPRNIWNSTTANGAMHLIQPSNTLGAEVELAGGSSVVRKINGVLLTGAKELIDCGRYGERERHSDPHIGDRVNAHARNRADVTLANPVGLYLNDLNTQSWSTPDNTDPKTFWRYVRGAPDKPVRAVYEVPSNKGYLAGDVKIAGRNIDYGAQIADHITIKLTAIATRIGQSNIQPLTGCRREKGAGAGAAPGVKRVRDILAESEGAGRR